MTKPIVHDQSLHLQANKQQMKKELDVTTLKQVKDLQVEAFSCPTNIRIYIVKYNTNFLFKSTLLDGVQ